MKLFMMTSGDIAREVLGLMTVPNDVMVARSDGGAMSLTVFGRSDRTFPEYPAAYYPAHPRTLGGMWTLMDAAELAHLRLTGRITRVVTKEGGG